MRSLSIKPCAKHSCCIRPSYATKSPARRFTCLSATEAELLRHYLDGKAVEELQLLAATALSKRKWALRRDLLKATDIDIDIPWIDHVRLRCFELYDKLSYRGDTTHC